MLVVLAWTAVGGLVPPVKSSSAPPASSPSGSGATASVAAGDGDDRNENPLVAGALLSTVGAGAVTAGVSSAASVDADGIMKLKPEVAAVGAGVSCLAISSVAPGAAGGGAESSCMNENPLAPPPPTPPVSVAAGAGAVPSVASVDGAVLFRKENDETAAAGAASGIASAAGPVLLLVVVVVAAVLFMNPNALPATGAGAGAEGSPPSWLVPLTLPPPPVALSLISRPPNIAVKKYPGKMERKG
mmetsp:Transcript_11501/g.27499  ORF Transcript_11501/g.27499 Transcript_11501/m.27499 type:complete len:244 (+) Transcript_11501:3324-4055(+)